VAHIVCAHSVDANDCIYRKQVDRQLHIRSSLLRWLAQIGVQNSNDMHHRLDLEKRGVLQLGTGAESVGRQTFRGSKEVAARVIDKDVKLAETLDCRRVLLLANISIETSGLHTRHTPITDQ
jgi:hypothetical protein